MALAGHPQQPGVASGQLSVLLESTVGGFMGGVGMLSRARVM